MRSRASYAIGASYGALGALALAGLACGAPYALDDLSPRASGGGPYFVCSTATPVPTVTVVVAERTATPDALGTPQPGSEIDWVFSTPVPTETPYYRQASFYEGQAAIIGGRWEVALVGLSTGGSRTIATFQVRNRTDAAQTVALAVQAFVIDPDGQATGPDPRAQAAAGLPDLEEQDAQAIGPDQTVTRSLAFDVEAGQVGLQAGWLSGAVPQPIWFNAGQDPAYTLANACAYGTAEWLPAERGGGQAGLVGLPPAPLGGAGAPVPPPAPLGQYAARPRVLGGRYPALPPFRFANRHLVAGHNGYDLTSCFWDGCPAESESARKIRMGGERPIVAVMGGDVQYSGCGWNNGYGCLVIIRTQIGPDDYLYSYYAHLWGGGATPGSFRAGVPDPTCDLSDCARTTLSALGDGPGPLVHAGQRVQCGIVIGFVGMSGNSTGPHLHWEVRRGALRPAPYTPSIGNQMDPEETRPYWGQSCADAARGGQ